jgi:hypothetical protein
MFCFLMYTVGGVNLELMMSKIRRNTHLKGRRSVVDLIRVACNKD